jgi:hypothetical protein
MTRKSNQELKVRQTSSSRSTRILRLNMASKRIIPQQHHLRLEHLRLHTFLLQRLIQTSLPVHLRNSLLLNRRLQASIRTKLQQDTRNRRCKIHQHGQINTRIQTSDIRIPRLSHRLLRRNLGHTEISKGITKHHNSRLNSSHRHTINHRRPTLLISVRSLHSLVIVPHPLGKRSLSRLRILTDHQASRIHLNSITQVQHSFIVWLLHLLILPMHNTKRGPANPPKANPLRQRIINNYSTQCNHRALPTANHNKPSLPPLHRQHITIRKLPVPTSRSLHSSAVDRA